MSKENFYAPKKLIKIWYANVDNIAISKLIETKNNSNYLIVMNSDKAIRPFVLIMSKMSGYLKSFKVKEGSNKLMSFRIDDEKFLEKYIITWTKIEHLKNIKLNALPNYNKRYIKTKARTHGGKVYTNFRGLNVPGDNTECESFTVLFVDSLLVHDMKYYLQVFLENCAYIIVDKQMTDYLD